MGFLTLLGNIIMFFPKWVFWPIMDSYFVFSKWVLWPSPVMNSYCFFSKLVFFWQSKTDIFFLQRGEDPPALMSVGVVHATSEAIFETVMSLGPSRAE
jgi:hypothetical protein